MATSDTATPGDRPSRSRVLVALAMGVALAALGSQILGEYEFEGALPFVAGPVLGILIARTVVTISRWHDPAVGVFCAAVTALGLLWAGRIDAGSGVESVKGLVWVSAVLGAATAHLAVAGGSIRVRSRR